MELRAMVNDIMMPTCNLRFVERVIHTHQHPPNKTARVLQQLWISSQNPVIGPNEWRDIPLVTEEDDT
jgi:uncharacterized protein YprB with RNaseH-like and TPR domain